MAHLDPATSIATCEQALRQVIRRAVEDRPSVTLESWAGERRVALWQGRRNDEARARETRGVAQTSSELLDYSNLFDLIAMCDTGNNWSRVAAALGKRKEIVCLLERLDDVRNAVAHGRALVPFEIDLAAGIAGDIRNRVTIYMSTQDPGGEYFPRIESVTDEFGNRLDGADTLMGARALAATGLTLRPGDQVRFTCHASDIQGRELEWTLRSAPSATGLDLARGNDVELRWIVDEGAVSEATYVQIVMSAVDAPYHRWFGQYDGQTDFLYRVLPAS